MAANNAVKKLKLAKVSPIHPNYEVFTMLISKSFSTCFQCVFADESGKMCGRALGALGLQLFDNLEVGRTYRISNAPVQIVPPQFRGSIACQYVFNFTSGEQVQPSNVTLNVPTTVQNVTSLDQLANNSVAVNTPITITLILRNTEAPVAAAEGKYYQIMYFSDTGHYIRAIRFGTNLSPIPIGSVVTIANALYQVSQDGKVIYINDHSTLTLNGAEPRCKELATWFSKAENQEADLQPL